MWHVRSRWKLDLRLRFQILRWYEYLVRVSNSFQPALKKILLTTRQPLACTKRNMVWATLCNPSWAPSRCINFMIRSMAAICVLNTSSAWNERLSDKRALMLNHLPSCIKLFAEQLPGVLSFYSVFVHTVEVSKSYVSFQGGPCRGPSCKEPGPKLCENDTHQER